MRVPSHISAFCQTYVTNSAQYSCWERMNNTILLSSCRWASYAPQLTIVAMRGTNRNLWKWPLKMTIYLVNSFYSEPTSSSYPSDANANISLSTSLDWRMGPGSPMLWHCYIWYLLWGFSKACLVCRIMATGAICNASDSSVCLQLVSWDHIAIMLYAFFFFLRCLFIRSAVSQTPGSSYGLILMDVSLAYVCWVLAEDDRNNTQPWLERVDWPFCTGGDIVKKIWWPWVWMPRMIDRGWNYD